MNWNKTLSFLVMLPMVLWAASPDYCTLGSYSYNTPADLLNNWDPAVNQGTLLQPIAPDYVNWKQYTSVVDEHAAQMGSSWSWTGTSGIRIGNTWWLGQWHRFPDNANYVPEPVANFPKVVSLPSSVSIAICTFC